MVDITTHTIGQLVYKYSQVRKQKTHKNNKFLHLMALIFLQVLALLAILYILQDLHNKFIRKKKKLPPGPRGLPVIGNLHMIGKNIHQDLHKIAKKYGPIMSMKFGVIPIIVASSPHAAEQFLKKHDLIFASRPNNRVAQFAHTIKET